MKQMEKLKKYLQSIRFRMMAVLVIVSVVPMLLVSGGTMHIFTNALISSRSIEIQSQINRIAREIGESGQYLDMTSNPMRNELERLSDIFDGRIVIVNSQLRIVLDTYVFEEGKVLTSESVVSVVSGKKKSQTVTTPEYIELITPIISAKDDSVLGAILVMLTTSDVTNVIARTNSVMYIFRLILLVMAIVLAIGIAGMMVKPINAITNALKRYLNGYEDERIKADGYTETRILAESFNKMLDKMQKLDSSRQEFVSNVSHELKTPITSIKVLADSLNGQEEVPNELYKEFMQDIVVEIDRENKIINDLLSLVRLDRTNAVLNIAAENINQMLETILRRLKPIAGVKNIELIFESFRAVSAEVDETKLTLAISNLIENAIKYNIENGWVKVSLNADHQYFYVKVEDSGIGIPQDAQDKIFERFYRVDKARSRETGGTGLGLSIVKNIIVMHKGSIKLYSKEEEGTTFTVRIPLSYIS